MPRIERAIIMAAGFGSRLLPYTQKQAKPLLEVKGKRMIDSILAALRANGIEEIYVVVGYLKEQFADIQGVTLIENPYYANCNNISSLYVAREKAHNCIILDGDQLIFDPHILTPEYTRSAYHASWTEEETKEWLLTCNEKLEIISCSRTGGKHGYQLFSISRWSEEDGKKLAHYVEKVFIEEKKTQLYWDDVALFCYPEAFHLGVIPMSKKAVLEIDSAQEYEEIQRSSCNPWNNNR